MQYRRPSVLEMTRNDLIHRIAELECDQRRNSRWTRAVYWGGYLIQVLVTFLFLWFRHPFDYYYAAFTLALLMLMRLAYKGGITQ